MVRQDATFSRRGSPHRLWARNPRSVLGPPLAVEAQASDGEAGWPVWLMLTFMALHLPLGLLMRNVKAVAVLHVVATVGWGLWLCIRRPTPLALAQWVVYVTGAEVLWRMCRAPIPWETAKHAIWFVCLLTFVHNTKVSRAWLPVLYFSLLIPGCVLTFASLSLDQARQQVAFTCAGHLCLALCAIRFADLRLTPAVMTRLGVVLLGPILGMAFIVFFRLATTDVAFGSGSTVAASGGYGPNQVSAVLGLGALLTVFLFVAEQRSQVLRWVFAAITLWLLGQAAMTLSRTGIYLFGAGLMSAAPFLVRWKGAGHRFLLVLLVLGAGTFAALPTLDAFTGGKLSARLADQGSTGRDEVARLDLLVWQDNVLFGVGAGVSTYVRGAMGDNHAAHTEYTRLLADHGLLGLAAILVLLTMAGLAFWRAPRPWERALITSFTVFSLLFMLVSAMRLAIPAILLALTQARWVATSVAAPLGFQHTHGHLRDHPMSAGLSLGPFRRRR